MQELVLIFGDDRPKQVTEALRNANAQIQFQTRSLRNWQGDYEPCDRVFLCDRGEKADAIAEMYQSREIDVTLLDVDAVLGLDGGEGGDEDLDPDTGEPKQREITDARGTAHGEAYGDSGQGDSDGLSEDDREERRRLAGMSDAERADDRDQEQSQRNRAMRRQHADPHYQQQEQQEQQQQEQQEQPQDQEQSTENPQELEQGASAEDARGNRQPRPRRSRLVE